MIEWIGAVITVILIDMIAVVLILWSIYGELKKLTRNSHDERD